MSWLRTVIASVTLLLLPVLAATASALEPLPAPTGAVILTIKGDLGVHNRDDGSAAFDMAMLKSLPSAGFETTTIWTDGMQTFKGVSVADLLARLGATPAEINAVATNDYEIRFPASDALQHDALIAYAANGKPLPPSDKGPLWIVYPYDSDVALQTERYLSQSVWCLDTITLH